MGDLPANIKVRMTLAMKLALANIAKERGEDTNVSDICREAIREYLERRAAQAGKIVDTRWRVAEDAPPYKGDEPKKGH